MQQERYNLIMQMLERNPNDSFLNYATALELKKNGKLDNSIKLLEKVMDIDPAYLPVYYQLGKLHEETQQQQKAIPIYHKGKEIASDQNDMKTFRELSEALNLLYDDTD